MRYLVGLSLLLATLSPLSALAQTQTAPVAPLPTLQLPSSTVTTCQVNCDTVAMNCQNTCVQVGPVVTPATPGACNVACASQQLVCKQRCGP
jgi:hypothetical protein